MRILFTSTAGLGHLLPLLSLATAAAEAGHQVRVVTPGRHADRIVGRGLASDPMAEPTEQQRLEVRTRSRDPVQASTEIFGRLNPLAALPGMAALQNDWRPDVIVSEGAEFAGGLVAEQAGIPLVRLHPGLVLNGFWESLVAGTVSGVRQELGLDPDPGATRLLTVPQISYFPRDFDREPESPWLTRVRRPGLPGQSPDREPLIYVTFGSEIPGMPMFAETARAAVAAARDTGCRVLLSLGGADPDQLGDLTGVEVAPWVDQAAVLPKARAVISHGGAGTTLDALSARTPTIAVPFFADQPLNAERLTTTRTGLAVPPGPRLTERLADALREVLADEPAGCAPMAAAVHDLPDIAEAVALLEHSDLSASQTALAR